jgi:hypothetical protein
MLCGAARSRSGRGTPAAFPGEPYRPASDPGSGAVERAQAGERVLRVVLLLHLPARPIERAGAGRRAPDRLDVARHAAVQGVWAAARTAGLDGTDRAQAVTG